MSMKVDSIASAFRLEGTPVTCAPSGNGHINKTFTVTTSTGHRYILQTINHHVFKDVEGLMNNVIAVTAHLHLCNDHDPRRVLTLIPTLDNTYGDFYLPAGGVIGPQARFFDCAAAEGTTEDGTYALTGLAYCQDLSVRRHDIGPVIALAYVDTDEILVHYTRSFLLR